MDVAIGVAVLRHLRPIAPPRRPHTGPREMGRRAFHDLYGWQADHVITDQTCYNDSVDDEPNQRQSFVINPNQARQAAGRS